VSVYRLAVNNYMEVPDRVCHHFIFT
jgi:hypothetical protein